jgi:hypothetical protein
LDHDLISGDITRKEFDARLQEVEGKNFFHIARGVRKAVNIKQLQDSVRRRIAAKYTLDLLNIGHSTKRETEIRRRVMELAASREGMSFLRGTVGKDSLQEDLVRTLGGKTQLFMETFRGMNRRLHFN